MNARSTIMILVCTLALAALAFFLLAPAPPSSTVPAAATLPTWLTSLDSTPIDRLEVTAPRPQGTSSTLPTAPLATSTVTISSSISVPSLCPLFLDSAPPPTPRWPADESRLRSALRLLADAARLPDPLAPSGTPPGTPVATLTITTPTGPHQLQLSTGALGGRGYISFDPATPPLIADAKLIDLFAPRAVEQWRSPALLTIRDPDDLTRIIIEALGKRVELRQIGRTWYLPTLGIRADPASVQALVQGLTRLGAQRFTGTPDAQLDAAIPSLVVSIESTVRRTTADGAIERSTVSQHMRILGAADAKGSGVLAITQASLTPPSTPTPTQSPSQPPHQPQSLWGPMQLVANTEAVQSIPIEESLFASKTVQLAPAADLSILHLRTAPLIDDFEDLTRPPLTPPPPDQLASTSIAILTRTIDGWECRGILSPPTLTAAQMEPLLSLLTTAPAAAITLTAPPNCRPIATLIASTSKGPSGIIELAQQRSAQNTDLLIIRLGRAFYTFDPALSQQVLTLLAKVKPADG